MTEPIATRLLELAESVEESCWHIEKEIGECECRACRLRALASEIEALVKERFGPLANRLADLSDRGHDECILHSQEVSRIADRLAKVKPSQEGT